MVRGTLGHRRGAEEGCLEEVSLCWCRQAEAELAVQQGHSAEAQKQEGLSSSRSQGYSLCLQHGKEEW